MSNRYSAVDRVMGRLFDRGHVKERGGPEFYALRHSGGGSHRRPSLSRMSRVGGKHGKAIFKLVTRGGTQDRSGLKGQMKYIFDDDKLARVLDSSGRLDPHGLVENKDINRMTLDWSHDWWANTRNGNTSHMILSYPQGTSIEDVAGITEAVCHEMFESGERTFKYVGAVHEDTEHHPHAHIIVNRRADDNTLLHMRSGTEHSYEGFRESMAAHAARRGIELDPTFRFERGIRAAQPTRNEQILAQKQGRAPEQKPHSPNGLVYIENQISNAAIMYNAMSVIAANADCDRLEEAYRSLGLILDSAEGDFEMPALNADELERFDEYTLLLSDTLKKTEDMLETKDAAARVSYEAQLDQAMRAFTSLSPKASYAADLHEPAQNNSIYMHRLGEQGDQLASPDVQEIFQSVEDQFGVDAKAISERLAIDEPTSRYLENRWVVDDLRTLAAFKGSDLSNEEERNTALEELAEAHSILREDLVEARVLNVIPHLDDEYRWKPEPDALYREVPDRIGRDVAATIQHYKDGGAPDAWISENKATIQNDVEERFKQEQRDFLSANQEFTEALTTAVVKTDSGYELGDKAIAGRLSRTLTERNLTDPDPVIMQQKIATDLSRRNAAMPHHVAESLGQTFGHIHRLFQSDIDWERGVIYETHAEFAPYAATSKDDYSLTSNSREFDALIAKVKENTTSDQYERLVSGDLNSIGHITKDPLLARQITAEVVAYERGQGRQFTVDQEDQLREHREYVAGKFDLGRDDGYER